MLIQTDHVKNHYDNDNDIVFEVRQKNNSYEITLHHGAISHIITITHMDKFLFAEIKYNKNCSSKVSFIYYGPSHAIIKFAYSSYDDDSFNCGIDWLENFVIIYNTTSHKFAIIEAFVPEIIYINGKLLIDDDIYDMNGNKLTDNLGLNMFMFCYNGQLYSFKENYIYETNINHDNTFSSRRLNKEETSIFCFINNNKVVPFDTTNRNICNILYISLGQDRYKNCFEDYVLKLNKETNEMKFIGIFKGYDRDAECNYVSYHLNLWKISSYKDDELIYKNDNYNYHFSDVIHIIHT